MLHKILVALDLSDHSRSIFEAAIFLAKASHAQLLLLHVFSPFDEGAPVPIYPGVEGVYTMLHQEAMTTYVTRLEQSEKAGLESLRSLVQQAEAAGLTAEFTQTVGSPGSLICNLAKTWGADLIVMGRRGRAGLSELLMGSVSSYVTHHAPCSVWIVQGKDPESVNG